MWVLLSLYHTRICLVSKLLCRRNNSLLSKSFQPSYYLEKNNYLKFQRLCSLTKGGKLFFELRTCQLFNCTCLTMFAIFLIIIRNVTLEFVKTMGQVISKYGPLKVWYIWLSLLLPILIQLSLKCVQLLCTNHQVFKNNSNFWHDLCLGCIIEINNL